LMSLIDTGSVLRSTGSQRFRLVAVVESTQGPLALAVDRVIGLRDIFTDEIAETLQSRSGDEDRPIKATTKDLVSLLDVDLLASSGETTLGQLTDTARTQSLEPDGVSQPLSAPAQQDKE
ncbi:MAG: hypothetical protein GY906_36840, partial [bacterium]|nr:hypothetical protein [bacterium]